MIQLLKKLDLGIYRAERAIVAVSLTIMSVVVFADVMHRVFADEQSKLARWIVAFLRLFGAEDDGTGPLYEMLRDWVSKPFLFGLFVFLAYFAVRTARSDDGGSRWKHLGIALVTVVATGAVLRTFIWLTPNGVIWAQPLALILTLWVAFLGASMCTYEGKHLSVEVAEKIWPEKFKPWVRGVSNLFTAAFVFFLFALSVIFIGDHYEEYVSTEGYGGTFPALPWFPHWVAYMVLPLSFAVMGSRFIAVAISGVTGGSYGQGQDALAAMIAEHSSDEPDSGETQS